MEQKAINHIKGVIVRIIERIERSNYPNAPLLKDLIFDLEKVFVGEASIDDRLINRMKVETSYELQHLMQDIFTKQIEYFTGIYPWTIDHPIVKGLIHRRHLNSKQQNALTNPIQTYIYQQLTQFPDLDVQAFIRFLYDQEFSDEDIVTICVSRGNCFYYQQWGYYIQPNLQHDQKRKLTKFAEYLIPLLKPSSGFLGIGKTAGLKKIVDQIILHDTQNGENKVAWLNLLMDYYPSEIGNNYYDFLVYQDYNAKLHVNLPAVMFLIHKDAARYEPFIMKALEEASMDRGVKFGVMLALNEKLNGKHKSFIEQLGEQHFKIFNFSYGNGYYYEPQVFNKLMSEAYSDFLFQEDAQKATARIEKLFQEAKYLNHQFFKYIKEKFNKEALPLFIEALKKNPQDIPKHHHIKYYTTLFESLGQYDLKPYKEDLIQFAVKAVSKKARELACKALSKNDEIFDDARSLLTGKTVDQRVTGALILSWVETSEAAVALNDAVDTESNDDTRDIMLEALHDKRFKEPYTWEQVKEMITKATNRKKLNKWNEKWIEEQKLPKLYWKDHKEALEDNDIRFLFYRMKRATGLNSDIEARQLLNHIDRSRSQAFTKFLLLSFQDSNSDTKLKYYLTLTALLGDDDIMHNLNALFKKNIADKRGKMAEYVVGALAMVGTDKALRIVEVIYRKFATKKPAISLAAKAALDAAAAELNITMDELADKIIPNFDFEGIYKTVTIEGEEYRAFINAEFKLNYFTEDNKIRKSLPSSASKELKIEFKQIEKELNDVIKSQSGRLEKYMIEERRWPVENWRTFFFNNPIMFVYALKLLWGVYDKEGTLITSFYCSEDTSLYDVNDEEVFPEEGQFIGILHPMHLTDEALKTWKDKVYALSMVTIFPVLERSIFKVKEGELESSSTKEFFNKEISKGADFVNTFLVKLNWIKSTGDGGHSEFTKPYKDGLVSAYANIEGPTAWYQGGNTPARMYEVSFMGKNWNDKVMLKDISPVFYSEVLSDIHMMINAN